MGTIAFPSDPVVNGAASIQSTTFANVATDYMVILHSAAKRYLQGKLGIRYFPGKAADEYQFLIRADLTGTNANLRGLFGVRTLTYVVNAPTFGLTIGSLIIPVTNIEIEVTSWYPYQLTLSNGSIITLFKQDKAMKTVTLDPENGNVFTDVGETRTLEEVVGMMLLRAAASAPVLTPAMKLLAGVHPLA
jgi:hypothetical protein